MVSEYKYEAQDHYSAIKIEKGLREILKCDRGEFGEYIDSVAIEESPVQAYRIGLAVIYANANEEKRKGIDKFLLNLLEYEHKSVKEIGSVKIDKITEEFFDIIHKF